MPVCVLIAILEIQLGPLACQGRFLPWNYNFGLLFDFSFFFKKNKVSVFLTQSRPWITILLSQSLCDSRPELPVLALTFV